MCVKVRNHKFIRAIKVQVNPEISYRILIGRDDDENIDEFYGICLENGIDAKSKSIKPFAIQQIVSDISYQIKNIEEFNSKNFGNTSIIYTGAINGKPSEKTDNYFKDREVKGGRLADKIAELWLTPFCIKNLNKKKVRVLYTKVCHKDCKLYKSCLQKV